MQEIELKGNIKYLIYKVRGKQVMFDSKASVTKCHS